MNIMQKEELEIKFLQSFKSSAKRNQREFERANVLLLLHKGKKDAEIADFPEVERTMIWRTRKRYLEEGLEKSLQERERSGQPRKYGPPQEAEIIALACSGPRRRHRKVGFGIINREIKSAERFREH
jgi:putative transposase